MVVNYHKNSSSLYIPIHSKNFFLSYQINKLNAFYTYLLIKYVKKL
jgi:hypothetical protein